MCDINEIMCAVIGMNTIPSSRNNTVYNFVYRFDKIIISAIPIVIAASNKCAKTCSDICIARYWPQSRVANRIRSNYVIVKPNFLELCIPVTIK